MWSPFRGYTVQLLRHYIMYTISIQNSTLNRQYRPATQNFETLYSLYTLGIHSVRISQGFWGTCGHAHPFSGN